MQLGWGDAAIENARGGAIRVIFTTEARRKTTAKPKAETTEMAEVTEGPVVAAGVSAGEMPLKGMVAAARSGQYSPLRHGDTEGKNNGEGKSGAHGDGGGHGGTA